MSKNHVIICMLTLFAWLLPEPSQANYMFKHYGVETGLSQEGTEKVSPLRLYPTLLNKKADCIKHYVGFAICF